MPYYLTHPNHGTHVCYTMEDVDKHRKEGWVPKEEAKPLVTEPKKRGRKPKDKE